MNPFRSKTARTDPSAAVERVAAIESLHQKLKYDIPASASVIGETFAGKTTLLRYIESIGNSGAFSMRFGIRHEITFVYINLQAHIADLGASSVQQFWDSLYFALKNKLKDDSNKRDGIAKPRQIDPLPGPPDDVAQWVFRLEDLINSYSQSRVIVFLLDNFELIYSLPFAVSSQLRYLGLYSPVANKVVYVAASRHLLYLLYNAEVPDELSPLANFFSDPIYLGLMTDEEADALMNQGGTLTDFWQKEDRDFVRRYAGKHPELIRLTCARLYELHEKHGKAHLSDEDYGALEAYIQLDASPVCSRLWQGLGDPELMDMPRNFQKVDSTTPSGVLRLSRAQQALVDVVYRRSTTDTLPTILLTLERRGLIEREGDKWRVFAEVMREFVVDQMRNSQKHIPTPSYQQAQHSSGETLQFSYLEGRVYEYLSQHAGQVCSKAELKQAIWHNAPPSDSALQKLVERLRMKTQQQPEKMGQLVAVRGRGFMLRAGHS